MTRNLTLPSKRFAQVDVPEPEGFEAEFVYGFWTQDERVNDSGRTSTKVIDSLTSRDLDLKTQVGSQDFKRFVPRYVRLTWKPITSGNRPDLGTKTPLLPNLQKVHDEETFCSDDFASVAFQDTGVDGKVQFWIQQHLKSQEEETQTQSRAASPTDYTKLVTETTPKGVRGRLLSTLMNQPDQFGLYYQDSQTGKTSKKKKTVFNPEILRTVRTKVQVNRKVLGDLLQSATETTVSFFGDEAKALLGKAKVIQDKAIQDRSSALVEGSDYDFEVLDYLSYRKIDATLFDSVVQPVGYIIDKEEILPSGEVVPKAPVVVENPRAGATADLRVRYGGRYRYRIRSVVLVELAVQDTETSSIVAMSFLVASSRSPVHVVQCDEFVPPPPPADFVVGWDFLKRSPRLTWSVPPTSQRDVKYFQLFRRKTIQEPFEMVAMWDWDTSQVLTPPRETPDPVLVTKGVTPVTYYLDLEFKPDDTWIYALCSIDAHQISSNYSVQLRVRFERYKNKVISELVSVQGAPKAYPNLYLNTDTFVDTMKVSGKRTLDLYFDPEYLQVFNNQGNDLKLVKTRDTGGTYRLNMINVDIQRDQPVTIEIQDRRTSKEKDETK